jgi:AAA family ATP:ADP antiporter
MTSDSNRSVRSIFWPIYGKEHIKFIPLALMMLCILFNYSMVRSLKDGFVVTEIGSEALGFLKTYFVFPSAIIMTMIYYKLCNLMDSRKVFYVFISFFLSYFAIFAYVLFPKLNSFLLSDEWLVASVASFPRLKWFFHIFRKWPYASFYVIAELWGSMMVSLFFWQLANRVTNPSEAKRHYSMFGLIGNLGLIGTSYVLDYALKTENYGLIFNLLISSVVIITALYAFVQYSVEKDPELTAGVVGAKSKSKQKLSMAQSLKVVFSSRYLGLLALLLIVYGVSNILIENVWKDRVKVLYPSKESYTTFMGHYQFYLGTMSIFFMLIGSNILRLVSWTTAAMLTPAMFAVTAALFFIFILGSQGDNAMLTTWMTVSTALYYAVMIGAAQNVLSKATKYSLFDSTQKMAYMPLDEELKTKGMSAVEVIGGRFGKMGGGVINSSLLMIFPGASILSLTPTLGILCALIVVIWVAAVVTLGKDYEHALAARQAEQAATK